jgi:non-specific serine/threonine protein kinase
MLLQRHEAAAERFEEALRAASGLGYREMIAYCLKGIGEVRAARAQAEAAARLLGASDRLFLELRAHMEASEQATYDRTIEQLKDMLGDDDYEAAYRKGHALALEESLELALGSRPPAPARGRPRAPRRPRARRSA